MLKTRDLDFYDRFMLLQSLIDAIRASDDKTTEGIRFPYFVKFSFFGRKPTVKEWELLEKKIDAAYKALQNKPSHHIVMIPHKLMRYGYFAVILASFSIISNIYFVKPTELFHELLITLEVSRLTITPILFFIWISSLSFIGGVCFLYSAALGMLGIDKKQAIVSSRLGSMIVDISLFRSYRLYVGVALGTLLSIPLSATAYMRFINMFHATEFNLGPLQAFPPTQIPLLIMPLALGFFVMAAIQLLQGISKLYAKMFSG